MRRLTSPIRTFDVEQTGRRAMEDGWSHSLERPTSRGSKPSAQTISVALAIRETIRWVIRDSP